MYFEKEDRTPKPVEQKPSLVEWVAHCKKELEILVAMREKRIYLEEGGLLQ